MLYDLYDEKSRIIKHQTDAYRDILFEVETSSNVADLWAYIDVEKKKAERIKNGSPSYDEWEGSKYRLGALENAEKWLREVDEKYGE